jgi:hypothetical protein
MMKALSLWQPWAEMIFRTDDDGVALKPDETRSWPTHVRGRIAIHAAKKPLRSILREFPQLKMSLMLCGVREHELAFGAIIGTVEIVHCLPTALVRRADWQLCWGDYTLGRWAFELLSPIRFETPIPYIGRQGFFNVPDDLVARER